MLVVDPKLKNIDLMDELLRKTGVIMKILNCHRVVYRKQEKLFLTNFWQIGVNRNIFILLVNDNCSPFFIYSI